MGKLPTATPLSSGLVVVTVGTGTCVPRLDRRGPCSLILRGPHAAAVDLGLGALHGLLAQGVRHSDLDAVFLTHLHPDHTAELGTLLFAANYDEHPRTAPLTVAGGPGVRAFVEALQETFGRWLEPREYRLEIRELAPGDGFSLGGLAGRAGAVAHDPSSLAFRFEAGGAAVVLSGDTGPTERLVELSRGADLLVVEASLADGSETPVHLTARQAGDLARRAGVGRLVLNHLYPSADAADPERSAGEAFGGPVTVARDGQVVFGVAE